MVSCKAKNGGKASLVGPALPLRVSTSKTAKRPLRSTPPARHGCLLTGERSLGFFRCQVARRPAADTLAVQDQAVPLLVDRTRFKNRITAADSDRQGNAISGRWW